MTTARYCPFVKCLGSTVATPEVAGYGQHGQEVGAECHEEDADDLSLDLGAPLEDEAFAEIMTSFRYNEIF
jgi:hypothetical protein